MAQKDALPLSGLVVLEMAGLAPVPYAGMILADFGAKVIRVDRPGKVSTDVLARNKQSIALNLKKPEAVSLIREMAKKADIILDPFRPGVMEKLGLGPEVLLKLNPRLIFARISGFGQTGLASQAAGHDINYIAIAGLLGMMGRRGEKPMFPLNIIADFGGGGLMCAMGILMALIERSKSGKGQVIDANLTSGAAYLNTFPFLMQKYGLNFAQERGTSLLDSGAHFYEVYETKDGRYMAVGAIEPQFYAQLIEGLGLSGEELPDQLDKNEWPAMKERFAKIFATKTQGEWTEIFDGTDACVTPLLSYLESVPGSKVKGGVIPEKQWPRQASPPQPAPVLSRTPAKPANFDAEDPFLAPGQDSVQVLSEFGLASAQIQQLIKAGVVVTSNDSHL